MIKNTVLKTNFVGLASLVLALSLNAFGGVSATIDLEKGNNKVDFLAVGRPGALKIHGETKPPATIAHPLTGILKVEGTAISGTATYALNALDSGIGLRTEHMKEKYLETGKFPTSTLKLTKLSVPDGFSSDKFSQEGIAFEGDLTLHGVTKPVKGTVNVERNGTQVKMLFEYPVPVTDFGIAVPSYMGITVAKDVTATVSLNTSLILSKAKIR